MPDDTTILSLPLILPAQAQKHVTHNEALVQLDLIVQLAVINRTLTAAPALPSPGDRHIVAEGATGAWVGQSGRVAFYSETGWQFTQPLPGWRAHVLAEGQTAVFDGLVWKTLADGPLSVAQLGVSTAADATNRLSVSSPATLLNHAGGGHQLKLNKAAPADTASLLFQTGFGGRAEMGTAGSDDFSVKVSADGATWFTGLEADAASGEVTLPQPVHLGGQAVDPTLLVDGTLWLNTTTGEVKVRSGGATLPVGGGGVSDGDKGDITVSGSGANWVIDNAVVTLGKMANVASGSVFYRKTAATGAPEVQTLATLKADLGLIGTNSGDQTITLTGDVTGSGTGSFVTTIGALAVQNGMIAADAVSNDKMADMPSGTIKGRIAAGANDPQDLTGTEATTLLDVFTSGLKGLVPASGGGTANFLRADGTFAAPGNVTGPASATDNALARFDATTGKLLQNGLILSPDTGELILPTATPATPAAGKLAVFARNEGGRMLPAFKGPSGLTTLLQPHMGFNRTAMLYPLGSGVGNLTLEGFTNTATGIATGVAHATTTRRTRMNQMEYLVTTPATSAVASWRNNVAKWTVGADTAGDGGFHLVWRWGPSIGVTNASHRGFCGMRSTAFTDVNPSTLTNMVGMAWDSADTNIQFMHNDGSGTASKIDLGASFPKPSVERQDVYEVILFAPPGTVQTVSYLIRDVLTGAEVSGTVTTDLPSTTTALYPGLGMSVGGVSSAIGFAMMSMTIESDY